jgi:hypothetical protein
MVSPVYFLRFRLRSASAPANAIPAAPKVPGSGAFSVKDTV